MFCTNEANGSHICDHNKSLKYITVHIVPKQEGGSAVDAVETAVSVFEESDFFNAGRGSALNCHGEVECDALIMDGNTMNTGIARIFHVHVESPRSHAQLLSRNCPTNYMYGTNFFLFIRCSNGCTLFY
jgi:beta-aspartyl-peptidase (threonine type)